MSLVASFPLHGADFAMVSFSFRCVGAITHHASSSPSTCEIPVNGDLFEQMTTSVDGCRTATSTCRRGPFSIHEYIHGYHSLGFTTFVQLMMTSERSA